MTEVDLEHALRARERAAQLAAWFRKRCRDPNCTGCSVRTLGLCALVTSPPTPAAPPKPVAPPFVPVPEPIFRERIKAAAKTGRIRHLSTEVERPRAGPEKE